MIKHGFQFKPFLFSVSKSNKTLFIEKYKETILFKQRYTMNCTSFTPEINVGLFIYYRFLLNIVLLKDIDVFQNQCSHLQVN